jgi:tetratricopeptide (TPR) repeat protein
MAEFQKAVQLRPDYAEAWSDLGGMRRLVLDHDGALIALERAVELKPDDALTQYRLGQLYLEDGEALNAVEHLKQAVRNDPEDRATLYVGLCEIRVQFNGFLKRLACCFDLDKPAQYNT